MSHSRRVGRTVALAAVLMLAMIGPELYGQDAAYRTVEDWGELPEGREWGAVIGVYPDADGDIWVFERCGANSCVGSDRDPILEFDSDGTLSTSFGGGRFAWPHGFFIDGEGNVWVTDAGGFGEAPEGMAHEVVKFSPEGEVLMTLGTRGTAGSGPDTFDSPSDVLVAPNGDIFVADGHGAGGNNRIVKFSSDGEFITAWGTTGAGPGEFSDPHALAMDSRGRLFVGDRNNNRIQIFDQDGAFLEEWTQFGRPSGIFIDDDDTIYVADSESNARRNPGWRRGIRIGSARTGTVDHFIPDPEPDPDNSGTSGAEFVAADAMGNIYGAEVGPRTLTKYIPIVP